MLANTKFEEIHVYYLLPGHSRMTYDRDFGRIEKKRRRKDRVVSPFEWVRLIKETDRVNSFNIVYVEHPVTDNMISDRMPVAQVKNYK